MIRCTPAGIFSWDFRVSGEGHVAALEFNWLGEQGRITADGVAFEVRKHGIFSGHWTLDHNGMQIVSGQKSNVFTRTFDMQTPTGGLVLRAVSPFGRTFQIERSNDVIATITPDHVFTRRATIDIWNLDWDFATICFSFWLVVLSWRRAAQKNS